jgi:hypothetical protein
MNLAVERKPEKRSLSGKAGSIRYDLVIELI